MRLQQAIDGQFGLDDKMRGSIPDGCGDLEKAAGLLHDIMDESTRWAYDALRIDVNGSEKSVTALYYDCAELMRRAAIGGEKTAFLSMSILEDTFTKALPLCLTRLESILDGTSRMTDNARQLQDLLRDNPYKAEWKARSQEYKSLLQRAGLRPDDADYSDLTVIMEPLLDALTFYQDKMRCDKVLRFRISPEPASMEPPLFSQHVSVFHSETELVHAVMSCGKTTAVMFAGLEHAYGETECLFDAWYQGCDNERMVNIMRHENLTREAYLTTTDPYSRIMYLCVKNGGTLYLMPMPYRREAYGYPEFSDKTKFCYGKRASYAPYQVFYKEPPSAPEDTTFLAVPRKGYRLSELMDANQKAWLPAFLSETLRYFFRSGEIAATDAYLPEDRALVTSDGMSSYRNPTSDNGLVLRTTALSTARLQKTISEPSELFDAPCVLQLLDEFHVTSHDLITYGELILSGRAAEDIDWDERIRSAYIRILCDRIQAYLASEADANWQVRQLMLDKDAVVRRILSGACNSFTRVIVHGRIDEKGNRETTSVSDRTLHRYQNHLYILWHGQETRSNPPVLYQVRPVDAEDYAALLGIAPENLPDPLRLYTPLRRFWENHQHAMPRSLTWRNTLQPKSLLEINLCMSKTAHKAVQKEKAAKTNGNDKT